MYQASVPVFVRTFGNLAKIMDRGVAHAEETGLDAVDLIEARLTESMGPLRSQVQWASDTAKSCAARLAGIEIPSYPDTETTFPELKARIAKTIAFLESIDPAQIDGSESREVLLNTRRQTFTFQGQDFLLRHSLPNFFFHVTTAYDILRHKGVPLSKNDYLGHP
ncbi:DUF1993 domain-containing protein [Terrihabitans sp. B22-R8]|uniref:DUF1993 domain-containing protein n=1 Tax=Terrihabitans sp. B22-R8 TaxID=3425128 RepID=UPI00403CE356